jgi:hypothetical protein
VATIVNGMVHIVGAGITTITATKPGNENYNPKSVNQTLTVQRAYLYFGPVYVDDKYYDGTNIAFIYGNPQLIGVLPNDVGNVILTEVTGFFVTPDIGNNIQVDVFGNLSGSAANNYVAYINLYASILPPCTNTSSSQTITSCNSYYWAVNGQTYNTSGTYQYTTFTDVLGCNDTKRLYLTIIPSTSNTTITASCDAYTWPVNGQTYTSNGTYTSVTGCHTEILNLTIVSSTIHSVNETRCAGYTWPVNGQTYTTSGSYGAIIGCHTEILYLSIIPDTSHLINQTSCNSFTWPVNGQTYTTGGTYTATSGCHTEILNLTLSCTSVVNLKLFIEGYYEGGGFMRSLKFNQDGVSPLTEVETITVELLNASAPYAVAATTTAILQTNGDAVCNYPTSPTGSFYIVVKTNNAVQTWSANPQNVDPLVPLTYDYTNAPAKAYGNNMKNLGGGVFGFYSGDINQDEVIDGSDATDLDNDIFNSEFGARPTDLNGDGTVDGSDATYFINNAFNSIFANYPQ